MRAATASSMRTPDAGAPGATAVPSVATATTPPAQSPGVASVGIPSWKGKVIALWAGTVRVVNGSDTHAPTAVLGWSRRRSAKPPCAVVVREVGEAHVVLDRVTRRQRVVEVRAPRRRTGRGRGLEREADARWCLRD